MFFFGKNHSSCHILISKQDVICEIFYFLGENSKKLSFTFLDYFVSQRSFDIYKIIVRFKMIGRVNIFPHNVTIFGAILLIISYVVEIGKRYILSYIILKMKQNDS